MLRGGIVLYMCSLGEGRMHINVWSSRVGCGEDFNFVAPAYDL